MNLMWFHLMRYTKLSDDFREWSPQPMAAAQRAVVAAFAPQLRAAQ